MYGSLEMLARPKHCCVDARSSGFHCELPRCVTFKFESQTRFVWQDDPVTIGQLRQSVVGHTTHGSAFRCQSHIPPLATPARQCMLKFEYDRALSIGLNLANAA